MFEDVLNGIYCGPPPVPEDLLNRWNFDPPLLLILAVFAAVYRRSPAGLSAMAVLAFIFVSPLCALSASLFSARVVHHVLLVAVAAPLLAIASPRRPATPASLAFLVSTLVLWTWHLPTAYDLALANMAVYWAMQLSLLATATLFWQRALCADQPLGQGLALIFSGYMQMALLGALLTFSPSPLYAVHAVAPLAWGFSPLGDQQLGGLIMWVPAGLPFLVIGAVVARRHWRALTGRTAW